MAKRGQLTQQVRAKASELLGRDITQIELRLMPYLNHCIVNSQAIDPRKVNDKELAILDTWREEGRISLMPFRVEVSKEFFDAVNELLWLAYVVYADQPDEQAA